MQKLLWLVILGALTVLVGVVVFIQGRQDTARAMMITGVVVEFVSGILLIRSYRAKGLN